MSYEKHYNVTSHKDLLGKLRVFAVAQGWVQDDYQTNVEWADDGGWDWQTGTSDFLQLSSTGNGLQDIIVRFLFEGTGVDPLAEECYVRGIYPGYGTPAAISTNPVDQNDYSGTVYIRATSLPSGTIPTLWLFGSEKYILVIAEVTAGIVLSWYFGSIDLFDSTETQGLMVRPCCIGSGETHVPKWNNMASWPYLWELPFYMQYGSYQPPYTYWESSQLENDNHIRTNCSFTSADAVGVSGGPRLESAVCLNTFSGKRPLIKPLMYFKDPVTEFWHPIGTYPIYCIEFSGLTVGQELLYGSEKYLAFPNIDINRKYGIAVRVV